MAKQVLILGAGTQAPCVVRKARAMGLYAIALDGDPNGPVLEHADAACVGDYLDAETVARVARECRTDGIFPPPEPAVLAAASAARQLGLPGLAPEAAALTRDKAALREAFARAGIPNPPFCVARAESDAVAAGRALGTPLIVKPADGFAGNGARQVDHLEELSLAFAQAARSSFTKTVLVERMMEGAELCVDGIVRNGEFLPQGFIGRERSAAPFCVTEALFAPASVDARTRDEVVQMVQAGLSAIGLTEGCVHVEVVVTTEGPRIIEIAGYPACLRSPRDLLHLAGGPDTLSNALRITVGEPPAEVQPCARGAAICWIPSASGVVTEITGVDAAGGMPGIEEVHVAVRPGDVMGHVVDCGTRDRVGYVAAVGETVDAAIETAQRACNICEVVTRPAY